MHKDDMIAICFTRNELEVIEKALSCFENETFAIRSNALTERIHPLLAKLALFARKDLDWMMEMK
jgi:hypothetical protein